MRYVKYFETSNQYHNFKLNDSNTPNISLVEELQESENGGLIYTKYIPHDYSEDYFTIKAIQNCIINIDLIFGNESPGYDPEECSYLGEIQYSLDNGETWSERYGEIIDLSIPAGNKVLFKGSMITFPEEWTQQSDISRYIECSGNYEVEGNIMSLFYGDDFINKTTIDERHTLYNFFSNDTHLIHAQNLVLPATTLAENCYNDMFNGCTSLTTAPELPATTLAQSCYSGMFSGCTSLTTAPELPATTLANSCYSYMFSNCTNLTTAPELPATTLASNCYQYMFDGCTSLTTAPELLANILAEYCYNGMFGNCTNLITAPELLANTLAEFCYSSMFEGCTSLNYVKCLAENNITVNTYNWLRNTAVSGTFVKDPDAIWDTGNSGIPEGWTTEDEENPNEEQSGGEESSSSSSSSL